MKAWVSLLCALLTALPTAVASSSSVESEALRLVDVWLDAQQSYGRIPALSASVVRGEELAWARGYGNLAGAHSRPANARTLYCIGSVSKLFTSVAVMQQVELGRIALDEPVETYLPWAKFKGSNTDGGSATVRQLLTHSGGLPREADFPYWTGPAFPFPTGEQLKDKLATQSVVGEAGERFHYSNLGMALLGEVVSAVSGEPYAAYVSAHILSPLGLRETWPRMPRHLLGAQLAVGYGAPRRDGGAAERLAPFDMNGLRAAGGYASTAEDLGRFAAWQFRLLGSDHAEVLKASTLREMHRIQFVDPIGKPSWGLGFTVDRQGGRTYVGHGGSCPGYRSALRMRLDDQTAVVVLNTGANEPGPLVRAVFAVLDRRTGFDWKGAAPAPVPLEDYAGRYSEQPWWPESVLLPWAGGLAYTGLPTDDPVGDTDFFKPIGPDLFRRVREDGSEAEELRFLRNAAGRVTGFVRNSNPVMRLPESGGRSRSSAAPRTHRLHRPSP
jgi:CubicO group peptidase (beta-lactamase class C family)